MHQKPAFLFAACQVGAESALKAEIQRNWPDFRFSYSRPGFATFKLPPDHDLVADFNLKSTFARSYGFSLGRVTGTGLDELAAQVWQLYGSRPARMLHVWQRDLAEPGDHDYEPAATATAEEAREAILRACPEPGLASQWRESPPRAKRGDYVIDCVLVEPEEWWIGYHRAKNRCSRFPGGIFPIEPKVPPVSRAWYKAEEALAWSQLPIPPGSQIADLGCAPGGMSQCFLQRGHRVLGIDPAEMAPEVRDHPNFTHLRRRLIQVRRREFSRIRWLISDMNVAPEYTLKAVESIVTAPGVQIRGMLLTLKLLHWGLSDRIHDYVERVQSWGFNHVATRQLVHNRQEICLAALKKPFVRDDPDRRRRRKTSSRRRESGSSDAKQAPG